MLALPTCGTSFWCLYLYLHMLHIFACVRVDEAMLILSAATREILGQNCQALEAKAASTIAAQHLVTLGSLRPLALQILFRYNHAA